MAFRGQFNAYSSWCPDALCMHVLLLWSGLVVRPCIQQYEK